MIADRLNELLGDVEIAGTVRFRGHLTFGGQMRGGEIIGEDLVVGPMAVVQGNITVTSLVLHGSVTGEVVVTERCELQGTASLAGSLISNRLIVHDGATLTSEVVVSRDALKPAASGVPGLPAPPKL